MNAGRRYGRCTMNAANGPSGREREAGPSGRERGATNDVLRVMRWSEMGPPERSALFDRDLERSISPALREQIGELIADVREHGDEAVCRALARFDGVEVEPDGLLVSERERDAARRQVAPELRAAIADMVDHIRRFNEELVARRGDWTFESEPGLQVGERVTAIASVGLFCPSGKASYPSVLAQIGTPAVVAGVDTIAVVVPPKPGGGGAVDPVVLAVADELGLAQVFRANGPAGVAALGFGTRADPEGRQGGRPWELARHLRADRDAALGDGDDDGPRPDRERGDRRRLR